MDTFLVLKDMLCHDCQIDLLFKTIFEVKIAKIRPLLPLSRENSQTNMPGPIPNVVRKKSGLKSS